MIDNSLKAWLINGMVLSFEFFCQLSCFGIGTKSILKSFGRIPWSYFFKINFRSSCSYFGVMCVIKSLWWGLLSLRYDLWLFSQVSSFQIPIRDVISDNATLTRVGHASFPYTFSKYFIKILSIARLFTLYFAYSDNAFPFFFCA